ncbi:MAG: ADP-glyceromanno-heptose 6-epimerase [Bacteroidota bacterium]|nr:ADP-glyceromanno-heptose 6-epimerase [Bacteroidota bacterium]
MDKQSHVIITGAAGFIGSCLVSFLNSHGYTNLVLVDDFSSADKEANLTGKHFLLKIERETFFTWLQQGTTSIEFIFHIGARTDTTEFDYSVHEHLNVEYSKNIWNYCAENKVPLVYASSAATYGMGDLGFQDSHEIIEDLKPLNPYGISKNEFDKWALRQVKGEESLVSSKSPPAWAGLKFFNVYGPNEYHKGRMASVIFHSYNQIIKNGFVKLFKSHKKEYKDGEQLRDFIYVKDVLEVCFWFMQQWANQQHFQPGIYNLGTGEARSFKDLVHSTYAGLDLTPEIQYIDMPQDIRETYQYYTQADMQKLRSAGYSQKMYSLEAGVDDYVRNYLSGYMYY